MSDSQVKLEPSWRALLEEEFAADYMQELSAFLRAEKRAGRTIYPAGADMFAALDTTPVDAVRVVIIGQDPYHGPGQAHGLCFSVRSGTALPPSLLNIYKEIASDLGVDMQAVIAARQGCLTPWARQGVLLLNSVLSVEQGRAGAHQGKGWERFTDAVVHRLVAHKEARGERLIFLLWGSYAQKKAAFVDARRHCVLSSPHPSPLSAHRGFFGSKHFSKTNEDLRASGAAPIDWVLVE